MFNQKDYINNFIKNNYKTIKLRIRNDDKLLLNKINSVENINQYLLDLITKDIYENRKYNYINDDIKIDFELSHTLKDLVDKAEEADILDDYGLYMNLAYAIDSRAKKEVARHWITEREWRLLLERYKLWQK